MDTKDNFDIFISKNFVRFSGKENVFEWLDETESKFHEFRMVRSLRFRAIPMLIEGDIELKYSRIREYIRTFDDFYIFLLSLYGSGFSTLPEAQIYLKLLDNPSNVEPECSGGHDFCQKQSFDNSYEFSSFESVTNCSPPLEEKFFAIVTDNVSNEEFSIPTISTDNTMTSSNSFDVIVSEQEIDVSSLNIDTNIGAAKILGVTPAGKVPMFSTEHSLVVTDKALHNRFKVNNENLKKKMKSSTRSQIYRVDSTRQVNRGSELLHISNVYQLEFIFDPLRTRVLCRYIRNRVKHSVCKTKLYKKRKKYIKDLSTNTFGPKVLDK